LRDRKWDLTFISLSVILVAMPYLSYTGLLRLEGALAPLVNSLGTTMDDFSRNVINFSVALLIGGPHMYATFTRTALDSEFSARHGRLLRSSLLIPLVVIVLALFNLTLLLTIFFFWASVHVLHQIVYVTELYNQKKPARFSSVARVADYAVILTSLYPLAAWKIAAGRFQIGLNDVGAMVAQFVPVGPWMVWLAGGAFGIALVAWLIATAVQWRAGELHGPKTVFIAVTVTASFFVPALGNLDTAFQGMNVWHSFQYLALTWMLNNLRQRRGELDNSRFAKRLSVDGSSRKYYLFNVGLTVADVGLAVIIFLILRFALGRSFDFAFDRAYYIAVLSFLWIHYYLDHYLFTQPQVIRV
jgi:hypothetical protein